MRRALLALPLTFAFALTASPARAYVESPHTLGRVCHEASNIVVVEVAKVNAEKGLIIFKKIEDLKGKHPRDEVKHNIGKRGFHEREWKNVMAWAEPGKKAVFFYNPQGSETCIGTYWYQCYNEGEWWGMSHAEPFLLRTYYGDAEKLAAGVAKILKNEEVVVPCLADGSKEQLHLRKGKLQRLKASLKRIDYDAKRDFVGWGGDGDEEEFKTVELLAAGAKDWKFLPASQGKAGDRWREPDFDAAGWRDGKAPVGYGEDEIGRRQGTAVGEKGQDFLFRRAVDVPAEVLATKGVTFRLCVASDDSATVYLNGALLDQDPQPDHEFAYWNRDIEIPLKALKPGRNVIAAVVRNKPNSSDVYFDLELTASIPLPKKKVDKPAVGVAKGPAANQPDPAAVKEFPPDPEALKVDKKARTLTLACEIAPRKLPHLDQAYPIEVIATYPSPRGQKAHETVVTFKGVKPSEVHKALEELGLKPGKRAEGEDGKPQGPELTIVLEVTLNGRVERIPLERALVLRDGGRPAPALKWYFTGSEVRQPDPEKDDKVYGADLSGTLISVFPVTGSTVIQSQLTLREEPKLKLETNAAGLPKEGTKAKLIISPK